MSNNSEPGSIGERYIDLPPGYVYASGGGGIASGGNNGGGNGAGGGGGGGVSFSQRHGYAISNLSAQMMHIRPDDISPELTDQMNSLRQALENHANETEEEKTENACDFTAVNRLLIEVAFNIKNYENHVHAIERGPIPKPDNKNNSDTLKYVIYRLQGSLERLNSYYVSAMQRNQALASRYQQASADAENFEKSLDKKCEQIKNLENQIKNMKTRFYNSNRIKTNMKKKSCYE